MESLRGLILSGGAGTRLRPITHTSAKQLVPVANKPVLFYGIEALVAAGITELGVIVAPETADEIRAAVGDLELRRPDHVHRAGRAQGPRRCPAHRGGVPPGWAVRHVPR
jgi:NDP-sugar pyrophosphorylase family protein